MAGYYRFRILFHLQTEYIFVSCLPVHINQAPSEKLSTLNFPLHKGAKKNNFNRITLPENIIIPLNLCLGIKSSQKHFDWVVV